MIFDFPMKRSSIIGETVFCQKGGLNPVCHKDSPFTGVVFVLNSFNRLSINLFLPVGMGISLFIPGRAESSTRLVRHLIQLAPFGMGYFYKRSLRNALSSFDHDRRGRKIVICRTNLVVVSGIVRINDAHAICHHNPLFMRAAPCGYEKEMIRRRLDGDVQRNVADRTRRDRHRLARGEVERRRSFGLALWQWQILIESFYFYIHSICRAGVILRNASF